MNQQHPKDGANSIDTTDYCLSKVMDERDRGYQQRWEAQEKAIERALGVAEKAAAKAEIVSDNLGRRIDELMEYKDTTTGKSSGLNSGWVGLLGLISVFIAVGELLILLKR